MSDLKQYHMRPRQTHRDYCYRENTLTDWDLINYSESTKGDVKQYQCRGCGNKRFDSDLELATDGEKEFVEVPND